MFCHKVSVIIPVYNVSNYLTACLESVINQSYKNLEILLIDDGSTDDSGDICDKYALIDNRIKAIHKLNGGLSDARNTGLDIATGSYITLVDSDDVIELDMIDYLYNNITTNDADMSICQLKRISDEGIEIGVWHDKKDRVVLGNHECMRSYLCDLDFNTTAWSKLYKCSLFDDIRYPVGKLNEDVYTTYKLVAQCEKIVIGGCCKYLYRERPGSIMQREFKPKHMDGFYGKIEQCKFILNHYPSLAKYAYADIIYNANVTALHMATSGTLYKDYIKDMQRLYRKYEWQYILNSHSGMPAKLFSMMAFVNLYALLSIIRIFHNKL